MPAFRRVGFWAGLAAATAVVGYDVAQVLQVGGALRFPLDEILIFGTGRDRVLLPDVFLDAPAAWLSVGDHRAHLHVAAGVGPSRRDRTHRRRTPLLARRTSGGHAFFADALMRCW